MQFPAIHERDSERAGKIILALVAMNRGSLDRKVALYKAFYFAHVYFTQATGSLLSDWKIIKMERGPAIDGAESLLNRLVASGQLQRISTKFGQHTGESYKTSCFRVLDEFSEHERDAMRRALETVADRNSQELSDITHGTAWENAEIGGEMLIYVDTLDDAEADELIQQFRDLRAEAAAE